MIKNYKTDYSSEPQEELQLLTTTRGYYNTWRVYFECNELEDQRTEDEIEVINRYVTEETITTTNEDGEEVESVVEVEHEDREKKTITRRLYESKFLEVKLDKEETPTALQIVRDQVLQEISEYDVSNKVNCFLLNGMEVWLDRETRVSVMNSTKIRKDMGFDTTTIWLDTISVTLPCDSVIQMVGTLELYALECYNVTAKHRKSILEMTTIEDIVGFDYTEGYPEYVSFKV